MSLRSLLTPILDDDRLTRGLDDAEARILIDWLVDHAERGQKRLSNERRVKADVVRRCRRARGIARFVALWCYEASASAALQLAATERFGWPLPTHAIDPCDLLSDILAWEDTPDDEKGESEDMD